MCWCLLSDAGDWSLCVAAYVNVSPTSHQLDVHSTLHNPCDWSNSPATNHHHCRIASGFFRGAIEDENTIYAPSNAHQPSCPYLSSGLLLATFKPSILFCTSLLPNILIFVGILRGPLDVECNRMPIAGYLNIDHNLPQEWDLLLRLAWVHSIDLIHWPLKLQMIET